VVFSGCDYPQSRFAEKSDIEFASWVLSCMVICWENMGVMRSPYLTLSSMRHSMRNILIPVVCWLLLLYGLAHGQRCDRYVWKGYTTSFRTTCRKMNIEVIFKLMSDSDTTTSETLGQLF
jgi:succinate dehydrogenase hydrophobic anchor subunit